jgi:hypothetical protein
LKYLNILHRTVGPLNIQVNQAFAFADPSTSSRRGNASRRRTRELETTEKEEDELDTIDTAFANVSSLWSCATDFWHVVGWAFNCSIVHKKRWERWELWLDYMTGVLEEDLKDRSEGEDGNPLIIPYLNAESGDGFGATRATRIVRAIFADGSSQSLAQFPEIWKDETKERKKRDDKAAAQKKVSVKVNVEEDIYGDYGGSSSDELEDTPDGQENDASTSPGISTHASTDAFAPLGGPAALRLRFRLLALLSVVSFNVPDKFISLSELYDIYRTHIRPFPLPIFVQIISPPILRCFYIHLAAAFVEHIATSFISSAAPTHTADADDLTQEILEVYFLQWPANTTSASDNAKLGACVETLLRMLDSEDGLTWTEALEKSLEKGIAAREDKGIKGRKRKGESTGGSDADRAWLKQSGERMRLLLRIAGESRTEDN